MTNPTNPMEPFTPFLPATFNIPEEPDRLNTFLNDTFSDITDVLNDKKIGAYTQSAESQNGEKWAYDVTSKIRNGFQSIARIKSFISETIPMPFGDINPQFVITEAFGSASKPCSAVGAGDGDYFSFMAQGDSRISFTMTDLQITITTTIDLSKYSGFIIIHYIRDGT